MTGAARSLILVLERDPAVSASLVFALRLEGFEVEIHAHPVALIQASAKRTACLLLDADHPAVSPIDLMRALRTKGVEAPAIFTATNPRRELRTQVEAIGARLLEKPWTGDGVVAEIRRAVARSAARAT